VIYRVLNSFYFQWQFIECDDGGDVTLEPAWIEDDGIDIL